MPNVLNAGNGVKQLIWTRVINLFNTAQFAAPDNMLADSSFGAITNTLNNGRSLRFGASFEF
jgi:hypothetical protein